VKERWEPGPVVLNEADVPVEPFEGYEKLLNVIAQALKGYQTMHRWRSERERGHGAGVGLIVAIMNVPLPSEHTPIVPMITPSVKTGVPPGPTTSMRESDRLIE
jgi:hypothetical protein